MNSPLHTGFSTRKRVDLIRQSEMSECGLACLAMIAGSYGLDVDLGSLRRHFQPSMRGSSLQSLIAMADQIGLSTRPVKLPLDEIKNLRLPALIHWDMNHFVVMEQVRSGKALIHNPAGNSKWHSFAELSEHFTGVAVEVLPSEHFRPGTLRTRLRVSQLWQRFTGLKRALIQTLMLSLVMQAFVLASPYYMQVAIDDAAPALDKNLLAVLALGFGLFTLVNAAAMLLRSLVLLSAGSTLGYGIASNIVRKLFRLPISWFEKRHVGDVLSRFQSIAPIQQALTQGAVGALIDGALAVLVIAVMLFYSVKLTLIALAAFCLYGLVRAVTFTAQRSAQEEAIVASGKEQTTMVESIRGITTLRLFNQEMLRHAFWQSRLAASVNANIRLSRVAIWQSTANAVIFGLESILSVWIAILLVISGGFSIGMVFAFVAYKGQFLARAASLIDQVISFKMLGLHLERLSDIGLAEEDIAFSQGRGLPQQLKGHVELRNVRFRYSATDPYVLDGVTMTVEPGEHVAITGPSGGGKSTLVKIILGLLEPESGDVLVDGVPLKRLGYANYRRQLGAVLQEDHLFAGSIADNIGLFGDTPDMESIIACAQAAAIHGDIVQMPMAYDTLVGDMGSSISGGQKQRVLIARALFHSPRLLVMDEGTSHLDSDHEAQVNATIADMGITRIVVAHRADTVRAADRVYLVASGATSEIT